MTEKFSHTSYPIHYLHPKFFYQIFLLLPTPQNEKSYEKNFLCKNVCDLAVNFAEKEDYNFLLFHRILKTCGKIFCRARGQFMPKFLFLRILRMKIRKILWEIFFGVKLGAIFQFLALTNMEMLYFYMYVRIFQSISTKAKISSIYCFAVFWNTHGRVFLHIDNFCCVLKCWLYNNYTIYGFVFGFQSTYARSIDWELTWDF